MRFVLSDGCLFFWLGDVRAVGLVGVLSGIQSYATVPVHRGGTQACLNAAMGLNKAVVGLLNILLEVRGSFLGRNAAIYKRNLTCTV